VSLCWGGGVRYMLAVLVMLECYSHLFSLDGACDINRWP
jgi:hypothetical protein